MGLRSKPQQSEADNERRVNELIEKGGAIASNTPEDSSKPQLVQLRLPRDIVQRIDKHRNRRTVPPSRHAWLLEALLEKLQDEDRPQ